MGRRIAPGRLALRCFERHSRHCQNDHNDEGTVHSRSQEQTVRSDGTAVQTRTQYRETPSGTTVRETQTQERQVVSPTTQPTGTTR